MIARGIENSIENHLFKGKLILLMGPRQVGKTTLLNVLLKKRSEPVLYLNGDESDVRQQLQNATSTSLIHLIGKNKIVFIDEAQRIPDIGIVLKLMVDQIPSVQVIASGSSAFELANQLQEPLTGRKYEFFLYSLSFQELSAYYGLLQETRELEQRLIFGSYPDIVTHPQEARTLLKLLAESYLYKDLLTLEFVKKPLLLEKILQALAMQIGNEVHYHQLGQVVGADKLTVEKYIQLLEKAYVIFQLPGFNRNVRNEIKKGKKYYFYDNGIRNAVMGRFEPLAQRNDKGVLFENYLVTERRKSIRYQNRDTKTYFWRTQQQQEIDYIEEEAGQIRAYEFKWNANAKVIFSKTFLGAYTVSSTQLVHSQNYSEFLSY